jgi:hypothetical protein
MKEHRTVLFGTAVSCGLLIAALRDRRSQTLTQRFMNARLIGQMAGIAAIIALAVVSSTPGRR